MGRNRFGAWGLVCVLVAFGPNASAGDWPLADAAERLDRATFRSLIEQRVDVNQAQVDGMTALHWAAFLDDLEMTKLLVRAKADVKTANRYGVTPLSLAAPMATSGWSSSCSMPEPTEHQSLRQRVGLDDRRPHREAWSREVVADRGAEVNAKETRTDRSGCGPRPRGMRRSSRRRQGGGRFPNAVALRVHAPLFARSAKAGPKSFGFS